MTKCTLDTMTFSPINRKKICGNFDGGCVTGDGGALLLREIDRKFQITQNLASAIIDKRNQSYIDHRVLDLFKQRVYALALGYADVNDHDQLRQDAAFQTAVGREVELASHSTISRFENSVTREDCFRINQGFVEHFIQKQKKPPGELILDFDPTDAQIYGHQQQRHYHGYYKEYCFLPLHIFCGDDLLVSYLRPCNIDGSKHSGAILKLLVTRFREVWPDVKIMFRGDSAFARKRILHWCEHNNVDYVVGIGGNAILKKEAKALCEQAENQYKETAEKQRLFSEVFYSAKSWRDKRRVIYKAEHHDNGDNLRFVVTNLTNESSQVYNLHYCPRGEMENKIKQQKLDLSSDRMSCHEFMANQFRVLLSGVAYVLITALRQTALVGTKLAKAYCQTIRDKLFKVGAIFIKNTRRIRYYFATHHPYQEIFRQAMYRLRAT